MVIIPEKVSFSIFRIIMCSNINISGPKRYDYNPDQGRWAYSRDDQSLGQLLEHELSSIFNKEVHLGIEPELASP